MFGLDWTVPLGVSRIQLPVRVVSSLFDDFFLSFKLGWFNIYIKFTFFNCTFTRLPAEASSSRMFEGFPSELMKALTHKPLTGNFHHYGVEVKVRWIPLLTCVTVQDVSLPVRVLSEPFDDFNVSKNVFSGGSLPTLRLSKTLTRYALHRHTSMYEQ